MGVAMAVELAYVDYAENLIHGMSPQMCQTTMAITRMSKPGLFEALLKEHPSALEELKNAGVYTPQE